MSKITARQAAARTGLSVHTVRYYERAGLIPRIGRADNGHRRYGELDLEWFVFVSRLRATGMSIGEIRRYTELVLAGAATVPDRLALLQAHRDDLARQIERLGESLAMLELKIAGYREYLGAGECDRPCAAEDGRPWYE